MNTLCESIGRRGPSQEITSMSSSCIPALYTQPTDTWVVQHERLNTSSFSCSDRIDGSAVVFLSWVRMAMD